MVTLFKGRPRPLADILPQRQPGEKARAILQMAQELQPGQGIEIDTSNIKIENFAGTFYDLKAAKLLGADFSLKKNKAGGHDLVRWTHPRPQRRRNASSLQA